MRIAPLVVILFVLHGLVGLSLATDLPQAMPMASPLLWAALLLSATLMPAAFLARRKARTPLTISLAWAGFVCMGVFSTLCVLALVHELLLLPVLALHTWQPGLLSLDAWRGNSAVAVLAATLAISLWGLVNALRTATVVRVDIPVPHLPEALHGFTMAQISDIHVGPTIRSRTLRRIVARVNGLQADLVAITGDLVDGSVGELQGHVRALGALNSTHGTFFVTGNHEYYSGAHGWITLLRSIGIRVLLNEHVVLHHASDTQDPEPAVVVVAGVTDFSAHQFDESHRSDPARAIADAPAHAVFKLLLAHQPRSAPAAAQAGFDLQLSGHTHGGQFWPWNHFVRLQQPFTAGLHKLQDLWVYTSRGTGYWGPPKRFGAPSEITHLRLVRAPG